MLTKIRSTYTPIPPDTLVDVLNHAIPPVIHPQALNSNLPFHPFQFHARPVNTGVFNWQLNFSQFINFTVTSGIQFPLLVIRR